MAWISDDCADKLCGLMAGTLLIGGGVAIGRLEAVADKSTFEGEAGPLTQHCRPGVARLSRGNGQQGGDHDG